VPLANVKYSINIATVLFLKQGALPNFVVHLLEGNSTGYFGVVIEERQFRKLLLLDLPNQYQLRLYFYALSFDDVTPVAKRTR